MRAAILQSQLGEVPRHLAYPYGYAKRRRLPGGRTGARGGLRVGGDDAPWRAAHRTCRHLLHALPRISLNGRYQSVAHIRTMLSGVTTPLANAGRMVVTV